MIRIALQTCLTVMALLASASVSVAAECKSDPDECTPKKLCKEATNLKGGNTVWSIASRYKHVRFAQGLGMSCGVVAIVEPCDLDANECKISQLCEKATKSNGGQTVWNSAAQSYVDVAKEYELTCGVKAKTAAVTKTCSLKTPEVCSVAILCISATRGNGDLRKWDTRYTYKPYVKEAKKRGLNCGVKATTTSVAKTCSASTPEACPTWRLCDIATKRINGKPKTWRTLFNFKPYVREAKKRGLTCGVGDTTTSVMKTCSAKTPDACSVTAICKIATLGSGSFIKWDTLPNLKPYLTEAKKRGLTCGVKAKTTSVTKTCSASTIEACSYTAICNAATYIEGDSKFWNDEAMYASYVKEAKRRGLTCGIEIANFDKSDFLNLSSLNRKQLQYGLKKLGYYTSSIDGLYGPNTQRAVRGYAAAKGISSGYPNSIYNRIVSDVNVPSSFAVASRPSTSSSSSSSSSSGVSDANKTLLGGLFIAGVCALTPDVGACLDGAMGNSPSTSSGSVPKISSNSCTSNSSCPSSRQVCIKKAGRGVCMEIPRGSTRYNFEAIKCSGSFDCPSRSKCDRTYKICVKR